MRISKRIIALLLAGLVAVTSAVAVHAEDARIKRLGGIDRFQTASLIADAGWNHADNAVLASADNFADALVGVPLAYALDAPILLVRGTAVDSNTLDEIAKLGVKNVYILGGTGAIKESVSNQMDTLGYKVKRIAGESRFDTAAKVADAMLELGSVKSNGNVFVAYAHNYPDALAVSSVAALSGTPILYAPSSGCIDSATAEAIKALGANSAVILGGESAVGADVAKDITDRGIAVSRCGGSDRYSTALNICNRYSAVFDGQSVCFATGKNYPDALAGGVFAAKKKAPVVLVEQSANTSAIRSYVETLDPETAYIFGGSSVLSDALINTYLITDTPTTPPTTSPTTEPTTEPTTAPTQPGNVSGDTIVVAPDTNVFRSRSASSRVFHISPDCSGMVSPITMTYREAIERELRPCRHCCANCVYPDI